MAARTLHKRILSHLNNTYLHKESYGPLLTSTNVPLNKYEFFKRGILSQTDPKNRASQEVETHEGSGSNPDFALRTVPSELSDETGSSTKYSVMSQLKTSPRHDLAMVFTCRVCETRSVKLICRQSYEKGVVVVRCGGCNNNHLIVDRLGWFGEPGSIENFLAERGEEVKRGSVDSLNFTVEDLIGRNAQDGKML